MCEYAHSRREGMGEEEAARTSLLLCLQGFCAECGNINCETELIIVVSELSVGREVLRALRCCVL